MVKVRRFGIYQFLQDTVHSLQRPVSFERADDIVHHVKSVPDPLSNAEPQECDSHDTTTRTELSPETPLLSQDGSEEQQEMAQLPGARGSALFQALQNGAALEPEKVTVMTDSETNISLLLLTPRLVRVMTEIRTKKQRIKSLRRDTVYAVEAFEEAEDRVGAALQKLEAEDGVLLDEQRAELEQEKADAELARDQFEKQMFRVDEDITIEKKNLQSASEEFLNTMEQALADEDFLDPIPEDTGSFAPQANVDDRQEQASQTSHVPLTSASSIVSICELNRRRVMEELCLAQADLAAKEQDFDEIRDAYDNDLAEYNLAFEAGDTSVPRSEFDRLWIETGAVITRNFDAAEVAHDAALQTARRLKLLETTWDQESGFNSDSDGYPESVVGEIVAETQRPQPRVEAWLNNVRIAQSQERGNDEFERLLGEQWDEDVPIILDLEARNSDTKHLYGELPERADWQTNVSSWDSYSAVDIGRNKKRIIRARRGRER